MALRRALKLDEVEAATGLKRSSIYQKMNEGRFPRAHKAPGGRAVLWWSDEIEKWQETLVPTGPSTARSSACAA
jgi:prophage regulatory protein